MTAKRPKADSLTAAEREPVTVTCQRCGHAWESRARDNVTVKCPACRTACRVHRTIRVKAQVRGLPEQTEHVPPSDTIPANPSMQPSESMPDTEQVEKLEKAVSRAATRAYLQPQVMVAARAVVDQAAAMLTAIEADRPDIYHTIETLSDGRVRLIVRVAEPEREPEPEREWTLDDALSAGYETAQTLQARLAETARAIRGQRLPLYSCEFCGTTIGGTPSLYRVSSPVFQRELILCQLHTDAELTWQGTRAEQVRI